MTAPRCGGKTRDGRECMARATAVIDTPADVPEALYAAPRIEVCGTHLIAFQETAFAFGSRIAFERVVTGRRP